MNEVIAEHYVFPYCFLILPIVCMRCIINSNSNYHASALMQKIIVTELKSFQYSMVHSIYLHTIWRRLRSFIFSKELFQRKITSKNKPLSNWPGSLSLGLGDLLGKTERGMTGKRGCKCFLKVFLQRCRKSYKGNHRTAEAISWVMTLTLVATSLLSLCYQLLSPQGL